MPTLRTSQNPAVKTEDISAVEILLAHCANVHAQDNKGDTCLHNATAWGNLKAVRALIQAGADPLRSNRAGWTPEYYSITVQAEVYYRNLVAEWEKRKAEEAIRARERRAQGGAGVRLVAAEEDESDETDTEQARSRTDSGTSQASSDSESGLGITLSRATWA